MKQTGLIVFVLLAMAMAPALQAASYYPVRLNDARAVYLTPDQFPVHGDGADDDTEAIQAAIDRAAEHGEGIVFVPSGRYRVTHTIYVWPAVRVIGYGTTRPVFVLADRTPGYQEGLGYLFLFTGGRRRPPPPIEHSTGRPPEPLRGLVPPDTSVPDANPGTFYSAMSNIDIELGKGNPAAVAIRFHVAQHSYLAHMDFSIGSGLAALKDVGNEAEDLHFHGGQYGIVTGKPSPGWQFTLIDSSFDGQSEAAIQEHEAGLTLIHDTFRNVPHAVSIDPDYSDELWVSRSRFEDLSGPAIVFGNENNPRTQINLEEIACHNVTVFAQMRASGKAIDGPGKSYLVKSFSHGLTLEGAADWGSIETKFDAHAVAHLPPPTKDAIAAPPTARTWVNLQSLGVKGDGETDDTAAIQKAIDGHPAIYVPTGRYRVTDTIHLRPDTVLIGLHPSMTQFDLKDESPAFQGIGAPRALLETPQGGHNIVTGIGLFTGGINNRAVAALWRAGADSLMDDVRFLGGHGTYAADGTQMNPYNNTHTSDPNLRYQWDVQYPSLWVTDGGGGTFADIWTPDTFAAAGLMVSNTSTPGFVYELSSEHHVRNEIQLDRVENWEIDALQTEEEWGESPNALPIEIHRSKNITLANYHGYRVIHSGVPFPYAANVADSKGVRIRNMHVDSNSKVSFDNSVFDSTAHANVRAREFASLDLPGEVTVAAPTSASVVLAPQSHVEKLADGFFSIAGGAVDAAGTLYFVDIHWQRIYRWNADTREAVLVRADPLEPENLGFDAAGDLLVVSRSGAGKVYTLRPDGAADEINMIEPQPTQERGGKDLYLPASVYEFREFSGSRPWQYVAPDSSVYLSAGEDFVQGRKAWGTNMSDLLRTFGLEKAHPGKPFYVTAENADKTFTGTVSATGTLTDVKQFAEAGGESVTQDERGRVYIAAGQILVYSPEGKRIEKIDVPDRPLDLVFGDPDRKTLFILTHHALYAVRTQ